MIYLCFMDLLPWLPYLFFVHLNSLLHLPGSSPNHMFPSLKLTSLISAFQPPSNLPITSNFSTYPADIFHPINSPHHFLKLPIMGSRRANCQDFCRDLESIHSSVQIILGFPPHRRHHTEWNWGDKQGYWKSKWQGFKWDRLGWYQG